MAEFSLVALKDEIVNDPEAIGYKNTDDTWTGGTNPPKGDQEIADLINAKNLKIDRSSVNAAKVRAAYTKAAWDGLLTPEENWSIFMFGGVDEVEVTADLKMSLARRELAANGVAGGVTVGDSIWAAADDNAMEPAMLALIEVDGSRGEVLWGSGRTISDGNVGGSFNEI